MTRPAALTRLEATRKKIQRYNTRCPLPKALHQALITLADEHEAALKVLAAGKKKG